MDLKRLRALVGAKKYEISEHALQRSRTRRIFLNKVIQVILNGEKIEEYNDDKPFPSCLILGWIEKRPIHVVIAMDEQNDIVRIITVYEPSLDKFETDFKTRRK